MSELCRKLHALVYKGKRFDFTIGYDAIPFNGIYIMFEKGEYAHGGDRIVRIGTHTGDGQLRNRIKQHFEKENKNRSIFRKNIGRCFLNKKQDTHLSTWNTNTATEPEIEKQISQYIRGNISFCLLEAASRADRLRLEAGLIGTVADCKDCSPSEGWLGRFSPKDKIRASGLWQMQKLCSQPLSEEELDCVKNSLVRV